MPLGNWFDTPSNQSLASDYSMQNDDHQRVSYGINLVSRARIITRTNSSRYAEHGLGTQAHRGEIDHVTSSGRDSLYRNSTHAPYDDGYGNRFSTLSLSSQKSGSTLRRANTTREPSNSSLQPGLYDTYSYTRSAKQQNATRTGFGSALHEIAEYSIQEPYLDPSFYTNVADNHTSRRFYAQPSVPEADHSTRPSNRLESARPVPLSRSKSTSKNAYDDKTSFRNRALRRQKEHSKLRDDFVYAEKNGRENTTHERELYRKFSKF